MKEDMIPEPRRLGLAIPRWREYQPAIISKMTESRKRFVVVCLPPGSGKSVIGLAAGRIHSRISDTWAYIVSSRPLQDQIVHDAPWISDVRGRANYQCEQRHGTCADLPEKCAANSTENCPYFDARQSGIESPWMLTNYAMWLAGLKSHDRDVLICDEAHQIERVLTDSSTLELDSTEVDLEILNMQTDLGVRRMLERSMAHIAGNVQGEEQQDKVEARAKISLIKSILQDQLKNWVMDSFEDRFAGKIVRFRPVWIGKQAHKIWRNTSKIYLMSGTISEHFVTGRLGIPKRDVEFIQTGSVFDQRRCPVYWKPTARMRYDNPTAMNTVIRAMDGTLRQWKGAKALIQSVSHERARYIVSRSQLKDTMASNKGASDLSKAIVQFRKSRDVLVSASVSTGFDFKGDACRLILIPKIPFPAGAAVDPLMKARLKQDKRYSLTLAGQALVQSCFRAMREHSDWCMVAIYDDMIAVLQRAKALMPWFTVYCKTKLPSLKEMQERIRRLDDDV